MTQRIITGVALSALLLLTLWGGGLWFAVPCMVTTCFSFYEMIQATVQAGHRPVQWPCWLCLILSIPLYHYFGSVALMMPLIGSAFMLIAMTVIFRPDPKLEDIMVSALPMVSVLLPGMCMLGLQKAPTHESQTLLLLMAFGVPLLGDTLAYFIGSAFGKRKLCPAVSPNKSVEGAIAGLVGSVIWAMGLAGVFSAFAPIPPLLAFPHPGAAGGLRRADGRSVRFPHQAPLRHQGFQQHLPRPRRHDGPAGQRVLGRGDHVRVLQSGRERLRGITENRA